VTTTEAGPRTSPEPDATGATSPYKGLTFFTEDDSAFFFGRERERDLIISNLKARRLTVVYGQSGVGKSSLLRAGVASRLRELAHENQEAIGSPEFVPVVFSTWRDDPLGSLTRSIADATREFSGRDFAAEGQLIEVVEAATEQLDAALLVILDQFEEYFLYHGAEEGDDTFFAQFPPAVNRPGLPAGFLVSIREDALAQLDRFKDRTPALFDSLRRVNPLGKAAAREAIVGPIEEFNRRRPGEPQVGWEPALVETVLEQVRAGRVRLDQEGAGTLDGAAGDAFEAPYLQLVMSKLWQAEVDSGSTNLRLKTLEDLGGAQQIVSTHLATTLDGLSQDERDIATDVFKQLVTPSGTKIALTAKDLSGLTERPDEQAPIEALLEKLQPSRIVRHVPPPPGVEEPPRFEIFHDVLASAILDWRSKQATARAEREKQRAEREARTQRRRARNWRTVAVLVVLVVVGGLLWDVGSQSDAAKSRQLAASAVSNLGSDPELSTNLALQAVTTSVTPEAQNALRQAFGSTQELTSLQARGSVYSVAYSPDGSYVAAVAYTKAIDIAELWNTHHPSSPPSILSTPRGADPNEVAFNPAGTKLAVAEGNGYVTMFTMTSAGAETHGSNIAISDDPSNGYGIDYVAFDPDGKSFATEDTNDQLCEYAVTGAAIGCTPPNSVATPSYGPVSYNGAGTMLVTLSYNTGAILWSVPSLTQLATIGSNVMTDAVFSPSGTEVATTSADGKTLLWDVTSSPPAQLHALDTVGDTIAATFNSDGSELATVNDLGQTTVWDSSTGDQVAQLDCDCGVIYSVGFDPTGAPRLVTGNENHTVKLWDTLPRQLVGQVVPPGSEELGSAQFVPGTGNHEVALVATASNQSQVQIWDLRTLKLRASYAGYAFALVPGDPNQIVTIDNSTATLQSISGSPKTLLSDVDAVAVSQKQTWIGIVDTNYLVHLYNLNTGKQIKLSCPKSFDFPCHYNQVYDDSTDWIVNSIAFDQSQAHLLVSYQSGQALMWNTAHPSEHPCLLQGPDPDAVMWDGQFDLKGDLVVTADNAGNVAVFDTADCSPGHTIRPAKPPMNASTGQLNTAVFNPQGTQIVTSEDDGAVRIWDVASGSQLAVFGPTPRPNPRAVNSAAFNSNGTEILTAGNDGVARLWSTSGAMPLPQLEQAAHGRITRDLTSTEQALYHAAAN